MSNTSGIEASEFKVLVEPKPVEEKIGSLIKADVTIEREKWASTEGWIRDIAPGAFGFMSGEEWGARRPQLGDLVIFAKYAGLRVTGNDRKEYILLVDKDICAVRKG